MVFLITLLTDDIQKAINYSGTLTLCELFLYFLRVICQRGIHFPGLYFLFASLTVGSAVFVFLAVPETKGKTPEEMRRYFLGGGDE